MQSRGLLKKYSVLVFFMLTYAISWILWMFLVLTGQEIRPLIIAGTFGPTLAALILEGIQNGAKGLRELLGQLLVWRVKVLWYLFSFLGTAGIVMASIGIHVMMGGEVPEFNDPRQIYLVIPVFVYVLFLSVLGEEIGWRGYALPRLQKRRGPLVASLIIGMVWSLWHLPLFWMEGNFHQEIPFSLFMLQDLALSIVITWLYNGTGGSLLIVHLFHAASNTTLSVLPILPMDTGGEIRPLWIAVSLLWVVAIVIIIVTGMARRSFRGLKH